MSFNQIYVNEVDSDKFESDGDQTDEDQTSDSETSYAESVDNETDDNETGEESSSDESDEDDFDTIPGCTLGSQLFDLTFVGGLQKGEPSSVLEDDTDWLQVMVIILDNLMRNPRSVDQVTEALDLALEDFMNAHHIHLADHPQIRIKSTLENYITVPEHFVPCKLLQIAFMDEFQTTLLFEVNKKTVMKSLKSISADVVASCLEVVKDVEKLEIPTIVKKDVKKSVRNDWVLKRHNVFNSASLLKQKYRNLKVCESI